MRPERDELKSATEAFLLGVAIQHIAEKAVAAGWDRDAANLQDWLTGVISERDRALAQAAHWKELGGNAAKGYRDAYLECKAELAAERELSTRLYEALRTIDAHADEALRFDGPRARLKAGWVQNVTAAALKPEEKA